MKTKHYCIEFEEGCRNERCATCCDKCKGYLTPDQMPDTKPNKPAPDSNQSKTEHDAE